jgi:acetyl esterase/lipase
MRALMLLSVITVVAWGAWIYADAPKGINQPNVVYAMHDATDLHLDFVRPEGDGPFPLVLCIHGGGWRAGSRQDYREFQQKISEMGFASASVQYRFAPKHLFPAQLDDVRAAIEFLAKNKAEYRIDPQRIATFGGSAGGHLALLSGLTAGDESAPYKVVAIVNICGPTDLTSFRSTTAGDKVLKQGVGRDSGELLEDLLGSADRTAAIYATASPINMITADSPAVLTAHGTADDLVPLEQAEKLHAALKEKKVSEQLIVVKDGGHDLGQWPEPARTNSLIQIIGFFTKHLQP